MTVQPGLSDLVGTPKDRFSYGVADFEENFTFCTQFDSTVAIYDEKGYKILIFISGGRCLIWKIT